MDRHIPRPKNLTIDPSAVEASKVLNIGCKLSRIMKTVEELRQENLPEI